MKIKILIFTALFSGPLICSNKTSICRLPIRVAYNAVSIVAYSDFATLAGQNSTWRLAEKIRREGTGNIDKYYWRFIGSSDDTRSLIYFTPLHEAVIEGNLEAVKFLLKQAADTTKQVKTDLTLDHKEKSTESCPIFCIRRYDSNKNANNYWEEELHVGRTAHEMATILALTSEDKISERAEIACLLNNRKVRKS